MNKDVELVDFIIEGSGSFERCVVCRKYAQPPFWISDISYWVSSRSAIKHRQHVKEILRNTGGETLSGFIRLTHCLSLNDTLWVKSSEEDVTWRDVSLYENSFNEVISKLSFEGGDLYGEQISITSPELTTDGSFDKCWLRDDVKIYLIKAGSIGASNAGREPYSEVLASQVFEELCSSSVVYTLENYHNRIVSKCAAFTNEQYGYKSAATCGLFNMPILSLLQEFDKFESGELFREMLVADAVTINPDRHFGNFGFLINNDTFEREVMAPVFDFNLAMFPRADWYEGFNDMDGWIHKRGPKIGFNYYEVAGGLMTSAIRSKLINLKDLELRIDTDSKFDEERLKIMNEFKNVQIDRILGHKRQFNFTKPLSAVNALSYLESLKICI